MSHHRPDGGKIARSPQPGGSVLVRRLRIAAVVGVATLLGGCVEPLWADRPIQDTFDPQGREADKIFNLVSPVFMIAGVVFAGVMIGAVYIALKFRIREDDDGTIPEQIHGHTALELGWTALPTAILSLVAVFTVATILDLGKVPDDAMEIEVIGQQWWWAFEYDMNADGTNEIVTANDLVVPAGEVMSLKIQSRDVIHSFWAPKLNGKKDAAPGRVHDLTIEVHEPGVYYGQCAEFCGLSHSHMKFRVIAKTRADFDAWVSDQTKPAVEPNSDAAMAGKEVFEGQCTTCHLIRGVNEDTYESAAQVSGHAPDLTHFASRGVYAGGMFDLYLDTDGDGFGNPEDGRFDIPTLQAWLRNPPGVKPMMPDPSRGNDFGRGMPDLNLTEQQIDDLVAYLTGLE